MTRSIRTVLRVVLGCLAVSVLLPAGPAAASIGPCLPSGGCASIQYVGKLTGSRGSPLQLGWQLNLTGTDIAVASLYVHAATGLSVRLDSFTLNGTPAPAGSVQLVGSQPDITVDLDSLLPLATAPGSITVGYTADVATTANPEIVVATELGFGDGGAHTMNTYPHLATLQVAFPDVAAWTTGTDTYIPRGQDVSVFFGITSTGQVDPPDVSLEIRTSPGFALTSTPVGAVNCHSIGVRRTMCTLPFSQPAAGSGFGIGAAANLRPGQTGDLTLIAEPLGTPPDSNPANNIHHMGLHVRGFADLAQRWEVPMGGQIPLGQPVTVTAVITNNGPDPATGLVGHIIPPDPADASSPGFRVVAQSGTMPQHPLSVHIARLAPHASYRVTLRVTGLKLRAQGKLAIQFFYPEFPAAAGLIEPVVSVDPTNADARISVPLTVVAATTPAGGQSLPATGPSAIPASITGSAMLLTGLVLLRLARRRRVR